LLSCPLLSNAASTSGSAGISHGKLAWELKQRQNNNHNTKAMIDVIVQYRQTPAAAHYARMASRGALVKAKLHGIRAAAFRIPVTALARLEAILTFFTSRWIAP